MMKLKIGKRRGREGESWDSKEYIFSSLISSSLSLCFSFARLDLLLCSSPSSFPPEMGSKVRIAVIGGDKNLAGVIVINSLNSTPPGEPPSHARLKII